MDSTECCTSSARICSSRTCEATTRAGVRMSGSRLQREGFRAGLAATLVTPCPARGADVALCLATVVRRAPRSASGVAPLPLHTVTCCHSL